MAFSNYNYYIVNRPISWITQRQGKICYSPTFKVKNLRKNKKLDVIFIDSYSGLDFPVDMESLEGISREEAELLMPLPEGERLVSLTQKQALRSARRLREDSEVWVEWGGESMKGIIRYIGNVTDPKTKWDIPGIYYGIELLGPDRGKGFTDGSFNNKRCFSCDKDCGVFAPFTRVAAVGPQTSSETRRAAVRHKSDPNTEMDQPVSSFYPDHFTHPWCEKGLRSEEDSGPKPLSADPPEELMEQENLYKDVGTSLSPSAAPVLNISSDPANALNRLKSKFNESDGKNNPKSRRERPEEPQPLGRPLSQSETTIRSWSEVAQTRFTPRPQPGLGQRSLSEESRSEPRFGPKAGPRTGPQPPVGPHPGSTEDLREGSVEGLKPGDQVMFFDEQERALRGTVFIMETVDNKTMVHIAEDSGTHCEMPLQCIIKLEQEPDHKAACASDSEDIYMDPGATTPPTDHSPDRPKPEHGSLGLESVVEITVANGEKAFGTIKWIGLLPEFKEEMAGLELEEIKGVSDGTFKGYRYFRCPDKHALFVKLKSCRPDSRFLRNSTTHITRGMRESTNHSARNTRESTNHSTGDMNQQANYNGLAKHHNRTDTGEMLPEPVPPISTEQVRRRLIGRMRGIQGHHNSCYMDSALFSLFSCSSVLDSLLFKSTDPQDASIQRTLLRDIVNPLRRDGFVEGRHVMNLRQQLQKHGFSQTFTTDEKDPEEFLTVIMHHILALDPLLKLCSRGKVQDSYCYQIFLDQNHSLVLPTVQQLLEHSFYNNALKLAEVPSCLILQMPRFGKKFKMFDKIIPSLELDVTELLAQGHKHCVLCGAGAHFECSDCFLDLTFGQNGFKVFCDRCSHQVHSHPHRRGHQPSPLHLHGLHRDPPRTRDKLQLLAVLCIETSHYVSFVKFGPDPEQWLFFDSMADREGEADGYNVPEVSLAPEIGQYLSMSLSELSNQTPRDMRGVAKRLICDAYLYLYTSPALSLYT